MTAIELRAEFKYRVIERLGILCGNGKPTDEQNRMAEDEARQAVE